MSRLTYAMNFFNWSPRMQGFSIGVALMTAAFVADVLLGHCR